MSTTTVDAAQSTPQSEQFKPYRSISRSAVVAMLCALLGTTLAGISLMSLLSGSFGDGVAMGSMTAAVSIPAMIFGAVGLYSIRRYPAEYTGKRIAQLALLLGIAQVAVGVAVASITYVTEVPEGYTRIWLSDLQPDPNRPEFFPFSPRAVELHDKQIFVKGYMHPGVEGMGQVNHFMLVFSFGECCFGGQPQPTHMIEVRLPEGMKGIRYSRNTLKLAGTFQVGGGTGRFQDLNNVLYHLNVDQIR